MRSIFNDFTRYINIKEILRKNIDVISKIKELSDIPLFTSQICVMELIYGITSNKFYVDKTQIKIVRINAITDLLSKFTILDFDRKAAYKTAEILGKIHFYYNYINQINFPIIIININIQIQVSIICEF